MPAMKKDVSGQLESLTLDFEVRKKPLAKKEESAHNVEKH